jgi:lactoylglutathione lyase
MADSGNSTSDARLDHIGLTVGDLNAMADWYCSAFAMTRELELRVEPLELDIIMLIHPTLGYRVELLRRPATTAGDKPANPADAALRQGYGHVAFDVADLDADHARLLSLGAGSVVTPRPSPEKGVRMAFVTDPEGNLVELLQRNTVTPDSTSA